MTKVLFVGGAYGKTMSTNGLCLRAVARVLRDRGCEVHFLAETEHDEPREQVIDGCHVHRVPATLFNRVRHFSMRHSNDVAGRLAYLLQRLLGVRTLFLLPWYPLRDPLQCRAYARTAAALHREFDFDLAVCAFSPLPSLFAGERLKARHAVPIVSYFLDTLTDRQSTHHFLSPKFINGQGFKYEKRFFSNSDLILNLRCHEPHFTSSRYDVYRSKLAIVDIPFLENRLSPQVDSRAAAGSTRAVYTGGIRISHMLAALDILSRIEHVSVHVYSSNSIVLPSRPFLVKHGQVTHQAALAAQATSDVLLSTGSNLPSFLPSKVIEYISTGKPVIHFYDNEDDVALVYFRTYGNSCLINVKDDPEESARRIEAFLARRPAPCDWNHLQQLFPMNRPAYTAELILNKLGVELE